MTKTDKALVLLLRIVGVPALFALAAVVMPTSWMAATHRWLGLGDMPTGPVVEYLARSLSAFYAVMGALCLVVAADLERYRPLVRVLGVAFALLAVFMPSSWMAATHRWLGLGEMPTGPVVEYLARDLSAFYALVGALLLVMASDLERYRPLVRFFALAFIVLSILFTGVDLAAGMPWWWTASEGPGGVVFGALLFVLVRPACSKGGTA